MRDESRRYCVSRLATVQRKSYKILNVSIGFMHKQICHLCDRWASEIKNIRDSGPDLKAVRTRHVCDARDTVNHCVRESGAQSERTQA